MRTGKRKCYEEFHFLAEAQAGEEGGGHSFYLPEVSGTLQAQKTLSSTEKRISR